MCQDISAKLIYMWVFLGSDPKRLIDSSLSSGGNGPTAKLTNTEIYVSYL